MAQALNVSVSTRDNLMSMNRSRTTAAPATSSIGAQNQVKLSLERETPAIAVHGWNAYYGNAHALKNIDMVIPERRVTAFIGPSGCGKSTLLRCFNRMNDLVSDFRAEGSLQLHREDIYDNRVDVAELRRRVGMVSQKPNPLPKSSHENVAYGARLDGVRSRKKLDEIVEKSLRRAALWDEVKDRLHDNALGLSGGQQQRLVIARAVAIEPEVLLLDEPASALAPLATLKIEQLISELKNHYTNVIATHNKQQAARVPDYTALMYMGELVEYADTDTLFTTPKKKRTEDYITGRHG